MDVTFLYNAKVTIDAGRMNLKRAFASYLSRGGEGVNPKRGSASYVSSKSRSSVGESVASNTADWTHRIETYSLPERSHARFDL